MEPTAGSIDRTWAGRLVTLCVCWALYCGSYDSNTFPLAFGMSPDQAAVALGVPLTYYSGPPGSEVFLARRDAGIPGLFPADATLALQFRRGHLIGWKPDWRMRKPWIVY
jgi:hypothetical protein